MSSNYGCGISMLVCRTPSCYQPRNRGDRLHRPPSCWDPVWCPIDHLHHGVFPMTFGLTHRNLLLVYHVEQGNFCDAICVAEVFMQCIHRSGPILVINHRRGCILVVILGVPQCLASGVDPLRPCSRSRVLLVILVVIHQYVPSCNVYITCPLTRDTVQHRLSMVLVELEHAVAMTPSIDRFQSQPLLVPVRVIHPCDHRVNWV